MKDWYKFKNKIKRQFTVKTTLETEVLYLNFDSLHEMADRFPDDFKSIFDHIG